MDMPVYCHTIHITIQTQSEVEKSEPGCKACRGEGDLARDLFSLYTWPLGGHELQISSTKPVHQCFQAHSLGELMHAMHLDGGGLSIHLTQPY